MLLKIITLYFGVPSVCPVNGIVTLQRVPICEFTLHAAF